MKKILSILTILLLFNSTMPKAYIPQTSNIYKEGIIRFDVNHPQSAIARLTTNEQTSLIFFNENNDISFYIKLPYNVPVELRDIISANSAMGIIGKGEVAITFE